MWITLIAHTTLGKTPLEEGSARRRDLCLTVNNIHRGQVSMSPAGVEPIIPASQRPQTYVLDLAFSGAGRRFPDLYLWRFDSPTLLGDAVFPLSGLMSSIHTCNSTKPLLLLYNVKLLSLECLL
jgi:hypothetical protein